MQIKRNRLTNPSGLVGRKSVEAMDEFIEAGGFARLAV